MAMNVFFEEDECMSETSSFKLLADVYRLGLDCYYFTPEEVVRWCEKVVETKVNPDKAIIDALWCGCDSYELNSALSQVEGNITDIRQVVNLLLGLFYVNLQSNTVDAQKTAKCMYHLVISTNLYGEQDYVSIWCIDNYFDVYEQTIPTDEESLKYLVSVLEPFKIYGQEFEQLYVQVMI